MSIGTSYAISIRRASATGAAELLGVKIGSFTHDAGFSASVTRAVKNDNREGGDNVVDDNYVVTVLQPEGVTDVVSSSTTLAQFTTIAGNAVDSQIEVLPYYN